jgi:hypothetical protein
MVFYFILFFLQIFMIFLRIYQQQKIEILLAGHSRQPALKRGGVRFSTHHH